MNEHQYWSKFAGARQTRRRVISSTLAMGAAAASLITIGCGGNDDGDSKQRGRGLLSPLKDRSSEAVRGGTLRANYDDPPSLDVIAERVTTTRHIGTGSFNRIFKVKPGILEPSRGDIVGDAAESYEQSSDGLQLTLKLRRNLGTDPRPPVNGRVLDAEDVVSSWNRWAAQSTLRTALVNSVDPNAAVISFTATDKYTVVVKLAFPTILILGYLTDGLYFWVLPRESEGKYDPRNEAHGAGPWYIDSFQPGIGARFVRNPNYYDSVLPYLDRIEAVPLTEPSVTLAQLEAKNLDMSKFITTTGLTNTNVVDIHQRHPEMTLYRGEVAGGLARHFRVGYAEGSIFRDVRMRRAVSMSMRRDNLAEVFTGAEKLTQQGIPTEATWLAHMLPEFAAAIDPRQKEFGPNSQYFKYDPAEAKKLISAAGQTNTPFDLSTSNINRGEAKDGELLAGELSQQGFMVSHKILDHNTVYAPAVYRSHGDYKGLATAVAAAQFSPEAYIYGNYHPTPPTSTVRQGDFPELVDMGNAILRQFDNEKRGAMVQDWIRAAAAELPSIPVGAVAPPYQLAWPWIANAGVFQGWPSGTAMEGAEKWVHYWYDKSKRT